MKGLRRKSTEESAVVKESITGAGLWRECAHIAVLTGCVVHVAYRSILSTGQTFKTATSHPAKLILLPAAAFLLIDRHVFCGSHVYDR